MFDYDFLQVKILLPELNTSDERFQYFGLPMTIFTSIVVTTNIRKEFMTSIGKELP